MNTVRRLTVNQVTVINYQGRSKEVEVEASAIVKGMILSSVMFHTTHRAAPKAGDIVTLNISWDTKEDKT